MSVLGSDLGGALHELATCSNRSFRQVCAKGHAEQAKELLEKGQDVESKSGCGETALHAAAAGGQLSVVKLLLEKGADPCAIDSANRTPLDEAELEGFEDISVHLRHYISTICPHQYKHLPGREKIMLKAWTEQPAGKGSAVQNAVEHEVSLATGLTGNSAAKTERTTWKEYSGRTEGKNGYRFGDALLRPAASGLKSIFNSPEQPQQQGHIISAWYGHQSIMRTIGGDVTTQVQALVRGDCLQIQPHSYHIVLGIDTAPGKSKNLIVKYFKNGQMFESIAKDGDRMCLAGIDITHPVGSSGNGGGKGHHHHQGRHGSKEPAAVSDSAAGQAAKAECATWKEYSGRTEGKNGYRLGDALLRPAASGLKLIFQTNVNMSKGPAVPCAKSATSQNTASSNTAVPHKQRSPPADFAGFKITTAPDEREANANAQLIKEREKATIDFGSQALQLKELFSDFGEIVHEQNAVIQRLERNTTDARDRTKQGVQEFRRAEAHQNGDTNRNFISWSPQGTRTKDEFPNKWVDALRMPDKAGSMEVATRSE
jgi:hypothetical protein